MEDLFLDFNFLYVENILSGKKRCTARVEGGDDFSTFHLSALEKLTLQDSPPLVSLGARVDRLLQAGLAPVFFSAVSRSAVGKGAIKSLEFARLKLTGLRAVKVSDFSQRDVEMEGFSSLEEFVAALECFYPSQIHPHTELIMYEFELSVEESAATTRPSSSECCETVERCGVKLAPYNPTSPAVVELAIDFLGQGLGDKTTFLDIGCGDGRVVEAFSNRFPIALCVGIEYDSQVVARARTRFLGCSTEKRGQKFILSQTYNEIIFGNNIDSQVPLYSEESFEAKSSRTVILHADATKFGPAIERADRIFVYLVHTGLREILDSLYIALKKGCKIVSYIFKIPFPDGVEPRDVKTYKGAVKIYFYDLLG